MKIKIKSLIISTSFLLVLFCFASADGMIQSDRDYIHSIIGDDWDSTQWETVENYMDSMPYFMLFPRSDYVGDYVLVLLPYSSNQYFDAYKNNGYSSIQNVSVTEPQILPWFEKATGADWETTSSFQFGYYYGGLMPYSLGNLQYDSNRGQYSYCIFDTWDNSLGTYGFGVELSDRLYSDSGWNFYWYSRTLRGKSGFYGSNGIFTVQTDWNNVKTNYNALFIAHSYTGFRYVEQNVFPVQYTEDSRLKLSHVFGLGGVDNLLVNLSEFYAETGSSPTSATNFSDVTLNLEFTDDQDNVTTESFVLSSSNSTIEQTSYPSTANMYLVQTPYSTFGDFSNYDSVKIVGCSFSRTYSVITQPDSVENFSISCNFYLKESASQSEITPEEIDLPEYEDTEVVSQSEIEQIRQQLQEDSTAPNANTGDWSFVQDHPVVPSWADHYDFRVIYSDANSFVGNLVNANIWNYYTSNDPNGVGWLTSGFIPKEFLHNNSSAMFYDMIIISVYSANVALAPDNLNVLVYNNIELQGYLVFYSERYYIHRQALTQQDILSVLEYESYNDILYYTYVKDKLDDFELKTLNGFSQLIGINKNTNSWLSSLDLRLTGTNQQLQQILTAINKIDIPEAPDLGEITDTLEYLFIPSFSWSTINYNDYLDSLGVLSMPFRFGSSVFSGLENGYSPNLEYHLYEASVPLPASLGVSGNSFKLWDDQDFTLVTASIVPDQDLLANIRLFNLIICIMSQSFLTYLHIFRREGGVEDGI